MLDVARNLAATFGSNYPEFPDGCLSAELALVEDVHEVLVDRPHILLKQLGDQRLREPNGLALEPALDASSAVLGLVEDQLALGGVFGHGVTEAYRWTRSCDPELVSH
ncbi:MAG: hypothetical protein ACT4TC_20895 [Myxococcaceae bacterium]